jgi:hypothetical protein
MPTVYEPEIDYLMHAIFDARCPGIRITQNERDYTVPQRSPPSKRYDTSPPANSTSSLR